jgi:ELWxxDGT repeat protein
MESFPLTQSNSIIDSSLFNLNTLTTLSTAPADLSAAPFRETTLSTIGQSSASSIAVAATPLNHQVLTPPVLVNNALFSSSQAIAVDFKTLAAVDSQPFAISNFDLSNTLSASPQVIFEVDGMAFFTEIDPTTQRTSVWRTDGTAAGTVRVIDSNQVNYVGGLTNVNGIFFFQGNDYTLDPEFAANAQLWKSDGTVAGTKLVKDIDVDGTSFLAGSFIVIDQTLLFVANDGVSGYELWQSDGTTAGTTLVKDIRAEEADAFAPLNYQLTVVDRTLFFVAYNDVVGTELWKSDGTAEGTVLVKDITPGERSTFNAFTARLTAFNQQLWFTVDVFEGDEGPDFAQPIGRQLWQSDGTAEGTRFVQDISLGDPTQFLTTVNGNLVFAVTRAGAIDLWQSDGTNTSLIRTFDLGGNVPDRLSINSLAVIDGNWFFLTSVDGLLPATTLWQSDGTATGTVMVRDKLPSALISGFNPRPPTIVLDNYNLIFSLEGLGGSSLWRSDGTSEGTIQLKDQLTGSGSQLSAFTAFDQTVFFAANSANGRELWKSDGTVAGTVLVKDINLGGDSLPGYVTVVNGTVVFVANDGFGGDALWRSDGSANGTERIKGAIAPPADFTPMGDVLYFTAESQGVGRELWQTNGTLAGTALVQDISAGFGSANPDNLRNFNGKLYFAATDSTGDRELWQSDGTPDGTIRVADINLSGSANPKNLTVVGNTLFFTANDGSHGEELWQTDGTATGTFLVQDIYPGARGSQPTQLFNFHDTLYFAAADGTAPSFGDPYSALWKSDGTAAGTVKLTALGNRFGSPIAPIGGVPSQFTVFRDTLFFRAFADQNVAEIWQTDGTPAGTIQVTDVQSPTFYRYNGAGAQNLTAIADTLFFTTVTGGTIRGEGPRYLWQTDGTPAGTSVVSTAVGTPAYLTNVNGTLFFSAGNSASGRELWRSDGTAAGTVLVKDIAADSASANPKSLINVNGMLYFTAQDDSGVALWQTDGTTDGTVRLTDPSSLRVVDTNPIVTTAAIGSTLTVVGNQLIFIANNGSGDQLWAWPLTKSDDTCS